MSVKIRLARHGRKGLPFYRIVVQDNDAPRDGRFLDLVGTYTTVTDPSTLELKEDRVKYWIGVGAKPSDTVSQLIERKLPGYLSDLETKRLAKIRSSRAKRKARAKKAAKATA